MPENEKGWADTIYPELKKWKVKIWGCVKIHLMILTHPLKITKYIAATELINYGIPFQLPDNSGCCRTE